MERQAEGFKFESETIKHFSLDKEKNYTGEFDAYKDNIPYSIKLSKKGNSICLGDLKRNMEKEKDFYMIIKIGEKIFKGFIEYAKYIKLFNFPEYDEFKNKFDLISNSHSDDLKWKQLREEYTKKYKSTNTITSINPKRDHKKQKRIQCSIPNSKINDFLSKFNFEQVENY